MTVDVGQAKVATSVEVGERFVVYSHGVEKRGVKIVDVDTVSSRIVSKVVGLSMMVSGLHSATGKPGRKSVGIVIPAILVASGDAIEELESGGATELAATDDEGIV